MVNMCQHYLINLQKTVDTHSHKCYHNGGEFNSLNKGGDKMNYSKFREAIAYVGISNREIARLLGISEQSLYNKATGKTEFKNSEIKSLSQILSLSLDKVNDIFFDGKVNLIH